MDTLNRPDQKFWSAEAKITFRCGIKMRW